MKKENTTSLCQPFPLFNQRQNINNLFNEVNNYSFDETSNNLFINNNKHIVEKLDLNSWKRKIPDIKSWINRYKKLNKSFTNVVYLWDPTVKGIASAKCELIGKKMVRVVQLEGTLLKNENMVSETIGLWFGHELAHHFGKKYFMKKKVWKSTCEVTADFWGVKFMKLALKKSGFNKKKIKEKVKAAIDNSNDFLLDKTSLKLVKRGGVKHCTGHPRKQCRKLIFEHALKHDSNDDPTFKCYKQWIYGHKGQK